MDPNPHSTPTAGVEALQTAARSLTHLAATVPPDDPHHVLVTETLVIVSDRLRAVSTAAHHGRRSDLLVTLAALLGD